jgi:hypothetical protein
MIRHNHYSKHAETQKDEISNIVNSNYRRDREAFFRYIETEFKTDMEKLK